mmetsp:Transcript_34502/g.33697  ORF Transcript_34502/g.33697 Transcript_34502/m.33697 type:complete len:128 (+) Transcript_34502:221-604(+)|eukprot:CAMPEP_0170544170 /NCGR_PEP_ID=MMETSP0211-20121228/3038_1 /TAXON_ID=311385 /ORGANISM="Pseudokeronopsis sp., Strain OXSARD2" /LENGTH=127 /DNA_ID=CAMNT_0010847763 /DNA_START=224 /DNA_END=607 /DNA_ORIENTATION=-
MRSKEVLKLKLPDIKKTLETVKLLAAKHATGEEQKQVVETNFLISDNIWARAKIPNNTGRVGLWLGANAMIEYSFEESIGILEVNLDNAYKRIQQTDDDLNFLKDQITTTEVNIARIYNQGVANNQK